MLLSFLFIAHGFDIILSIVLSFSPMRGWNVTCPFLNGSFVPRVW